MRRAVVLYATDQRRDQRVDRVVDLVFGGAEFLGDVLYRDLREKLIETGHFSTFFCWLWTTPARQ
jgi:hypothetical protein